MSKVTAEHLGGLLFSIHSHIGEFVKDKKHLRKSMVKNKDGGDIIYKEDDLIEVLKVLGLPEPKWGLCITVDKYKEYVQFDSMLRNHDFYFRSSESTTVYNVGMKQEEEIKVWAARNPQFEEIYKERLKRHFPQGKW